MATCNTDQLLILVTRRHDALVQLRDLGRLQLQLVSEESLTDLLKVLAAKQRLLGDLVPLERALDAYRDDLPERRQWTLAADRQRCAKLIEVSRAMLAEIVANEQQSEALLTQHRDEIGRRLNGAHAIQQAQGAYVADSDVPRGELDLSSQC